MLPHRDRSCRSNFLQSQYTDTGPTSPGADPITPGDWQVSHWSARFEVTGLTRPAKKSLQPKRESIPGSTALKADAITSRPTRRQMGKKPLTYLCPSLPVEHRPSTTSPPQPPPVHSVLGCSGHSGPVGPLLFQLCFSVSPPTVARPASLPLPLRVPGQGLACGAGCWLPEGVSDPAPLPPQYLLGHWFQSRSLPQIFISKETSLKL